MFHVHFGRVVFLPPTINFSCSASPTKCGKKTKLDLCIFLSVWCCHHFCSCWCRSSTGHTKRVERESYSGKSLYKRCIWWHAFITLASRKQQKDLEWYHSNVICHGVSHLRLYMDPVRQHYWQLFEVKARILVDTKGGDKFLWLSINNQGVVNIPFQPFLPKEDLVIHILW